MATSQPHACKLLFDFGKHQFTQSTMKLFHVLYFFLFFAELKRKFFFVVFKIRLSLVIFIYFFSELLHSLIQFSVSLGNLFYFLGCFELFLDLSLQGFIKSLNLVFELSALFFFLFAIFFKECNLML